MVDIVVAVGCMGWYEFGDRPAGVQSGEHVREALSLYQGDLVNCERRTVRW